MRRLIKSKFILFAIVMSAILCLVLMPSYAATVQWREGLSALWTHFWLAFGIGDAAAGAGPQLNPFTPFREGKKILLLFAIPPASLLISLIFSYVFWLIVKLEVIGNDELELIDTRKQQLVAIHQENAELSERISMRLQHIDNLAKSSHGWLKQMPDLSQRSIEFLQSLATAYQQLYKEALETRDIVEATKVDLHADKAVDISKLEDGD